MATGVYPRPSTETLFWKKVQKNDSCWLWIGCREEKGYGQFRVKGKMWAAHRYSFFLEYGNIPSGKIVMHSCDTPSCVRPTHLRAGTWQENMDDMIKKGREYHPPMISRKGRFFAKAV